MNSMAALATPRRREILRLVWTSEAPAGDIHRALGDVSFAAVSQHLAVLAHAGFVSVRRAGRQRFYQARPESLGELRAWLESSWDDALYRLTIKAELEHARRGPRPRRRRQVHPARRGPRSP